MIPTPQSIDSTSKSSESQEILESESLKIYGTGRSEFLQTKKAQLQLYLGSVP